jgi:hypothetical protein
LVKVGEAVSDLLIDRDHIEHPPRGDHRTTMVASHGTLGRGVFVGIPLLLHCLSLSRYTGHAKISSCDWTRSA